jgi:hypothetical protein
MWFDFPWWTPGRTAMELSEAGSIWADATGWIPMSTPDEIPDDLTFFRIGKITIFNGKIHYK